MALLNGQNVCDTVAFRISNRLAANGTGAGSIIECANMALGLISAAGSWAWDQTSVSGVSGPSYPLTPSGSVDLGKEMAFFNINGTRIERAKTSDTFSASTGYVNAGGSAPGLYNTYRLLVDSGFGTYDPMVNFYPDTVTASVNGVFHLLPPVLVYGSSPTVRWQEKAMDMLLIDWTEAYVKKILSMAGWDTTWADCIRRVGDFKTTYSSQRENTGTEAESEDSAKEKMIGRD